MCVCATAEVTQILTAYMHMKLNKMRYTAFNHVLHELFGMWSYRWMCLCMWEHYSPHHAMPVLSHGRHSKAVQRHMKLRAPPCLSSHASTLPLPKVSIYCRCEMPDASRPQWSPCWAQSIVSACVKKRRPLQLKAGCGMHTNVLEFLFWQKKKKKKQ